MHETAGAWTFLDWLPVAEPTLEVPNNTIADYAASIVAHGPRSAREGPPIYGTYTTENPIPTEALDPSFHVRSKEYFQPGTVFSVLFSEAAGATATSYNDSFSMVKYGEYAYSQVRRFVVVRQKKAHCFAIPIFTYGGQGTLKNGVNPWDHAIAYSDGQSPVRLPGESEMGKPPICIVLHQPNPPLSSASRIYFGIHHPIQYNVKVKDIGYVHPDCLGNFLDSWVAQVREMMDGDEYDRGSSARISEKASLPTEGITRPTSTQGPGSGFETVKNPRKFFKKGRVFSTTISDSKGEKIATKHFAVVKPQSTRSVCIEIEISDSDALPDEYASVKRVDDASIDPVLDVHAPERTVYFKTEALSSEMSASMRTNFAPIEIDHGVEVHNLGRVFGNSIGVMEQHLRAETLHYAA